MHVWNEEMSLKLMRLNTLSSTPDHKAAIESRANLARLSQTILLDAPQKVPPFRRKKKKRQATTTNKKTGYITGEQPQEACTHTFQE